MIYFYGGAFNPMTKAHFEIIENIVKNMKKDDEFILAITDHNYKTYTYDYYLRKRIVCKNLEKFGFKPRFESNSRFKILRQNERTFNFLAHCTLMKNYIYRKDFVIVLGEDEWDDLNAGKWHYSKELLNTYNFKVIPRTDDISSTKVRELLKNNVGFDELQNYITRETYDILKEV